MSFPGLTKNQNLLILFNLTRSSSQTSRKMMIHDSAEIGVKLTQEFLPDARKRDHQKTGERW